MKKTACTTTSLALALGLSLGAAACASDAADDDDDDGNPTPGEAFLTIVGDANVFLENGFVGQIGVRYHDADGKPLAGEVAFRIEGVANGASLSAGARATNGDGVAQVTLTAGATGEAVFTIVAEAAGADPVEWTVSVSESQPAVPLDATGRYAVTSEFDVVSGIPGTAGDILNGFLEMTDDPYDPATFLIDTILAEADLGSFLEGAIGAARPALDGIVNDLLLDLSPDFVDTILDVGDKLGQATRRFGVVSTLDVQKVDGVEGEELQAAHVVTGVAFTIDGTRYPYTMEELSLARIEVGQVPFRMEGETRVYVGEHSFTLSYGSLVLVALNEIIIPLVDPAASDLAGLLEGLIDCVAVGAELSASIGLGSPSLYEGACHIAITAAASELEDQILSLDDAGLVLTISGDAKPLDTDADRKVDRLSNGLWEGTISYAGTPAPLTRPDNTFRGERVVVP